MDLNIQRPPTDMPDPTEQNCCCRPSRVAACRAGRGSGDAGQWHGGSSRARGFPLPGTRVVPAPTTQPPAPTPDPPPAATEPRGRVSPLPPPLPPASATPQTQRAAPRAAVPPAVAQRRSALPRPAPHPLPPPPLLLPGRPCGGPVDLARRVPDRPRLFRPRTIPVRPALAPVLPLPKAMRSLPSAT
jgi:hypothetical protein